MHKSHSGAKKRFSVTATGKIKYKKGFSRHLLTRKGTKRKRLLRRDGIMAKVDQKHIQSLLALR